MDEPILAADLVRMAEAFTKWSYEVRSAEEAPRALRRALKVARTPPTGPVFLSLPMDLLRGVVEDAGEGPVALATRSRPEPEAVEHAARLLAWARRAPFRRELSVIQVDDDPWEVGRSYPVALGIVADPREALVELTRALASRMTDPARRAARERAETIGRGRAEIVARMRVAAEAEAQRAPIGQAHLMHTLASLLPRDAVVVDESATSLPFVLRYMPFATPASFFGSKTGTLGWGMGAAIGVQLALPGRKVVATVGDGSVMYAPQALWTAARYRLPITYVVPNNTSYAILKSGMLSLDLPSAKRGIFPGMDLVDPEIDYAGLAKALGVRAERVEKPGELREVLAECLSDAGPSLVDVAIDRGFKAML